MVRSVLVLGWSLALFVACATGGGRERFAVRAPTAEWESVAVDRTDESEPPPLLVLANRQTGAMVRVDELYGVTPGAAALEVMAIHERADITISEIDFSDPDGRVSFRTSGAMEGIDRKGKVTAFRLPNHRAAVFMLTGLWPAAADAAMVAQFDALVANAKIVKPWW
jgi:hypothetical protein